MNVLSLFDGMSCGMVAGKRAGLNIKNYYACEIDKYAMQISNKNYPGIIQLGDVSDHKPFFKIPKIDLLLGGSPCQGFSFAGNQLAFDDPRSKLFFEYIRILKDLKIINPDIKFLLENVRMKREYLDVISEYLGVEPICVNSNLFSAQNRTRYYWTNIEGVEQPEDKGIFLRDIIETNGDFNNYILSEKAIERIKRKKYSSPKVCPDKTGCINTANNSPRLCFDGGTTLVPVVIFQRGRGNNPGGDRAVDGKTPCLSSSSWQQNNFLVIGEQYRRLTEVECERLQTLPDNYTEGVSATQRYKMIGNGWTIDVIAHILKGLKC